MQLKRLPDAGSVLRLEAVQQDVRGDATPNLDQVGVWLGKRGFAGEALLSLAETESIDTSGLSWLLSCHKRFAAAGGKLVIHSIPPIVLDTLMIMRLELVLFLAEDEPSAQAML